MATLGHQDRTLHLRLVVKAFNEPSPSRRRLLSRPARLTQIFDNFYLAVLALKLSKQQHSNDLLLLSVCRAMARRVIGDV